MNDSDVGPGSDRTTSGRGKPDQQRIRIEQHSASGMFWIIGWLFTIGFGHLSFWRGLLALIIWPYYLGTMISSLVAR